jgi:hypothetical protein
MPERSHVIPGPPETHFRGVKNCDVLFPKAVHSQIMSHSEHHEGDGGEGTISTYVVHPADGSTVTLKSLMEVYDETTYTYVISFQGDPRYTSLKFTVRFLPGPSADTSTLTWFAEYTPISGDTPAPDNLMDIVPHLFENFAGHAEAHFADQAKIVNL